MENRFVIIYFYMLLRMGIWKPTNPSKRLSICAMRKRERKKDNLPHCVTHLASEVLLLSYQYRHQFQIYHPKIHSVWLFHRHFHHFVIDFWAMIFYRIWLVAFSATLIVQLLMSSTVTHQLLPIWISTRKISLGFL